MKNQRPYLNALSSLASLKFRIRKRTMRHPPRPTIRLTIKNLKSYHLFRRLLTYIIPPMTPIFPLLRWMPDLHSLKLIRRVHDRNGNKLVFQDGPGVHHCKWVFVYRLNRSPDIDDLKPAFGKTFSFWTGKHGFHEFRSIGVALIDVSASSWALNLSWNGLLLAEFSFGFIVVI
jgi:hypothetical protein